MAIRTSLGTPTANSYVSVASANSYFEVRDNSDAWDALSTSAFTNTSTGQRVAKEQLLIQATREIDFNLRFHSAKYNQGMKGQSTYQNLEFPRWDNTDASANLYLPDEVKYATYEQALWIASRKGLKTTPEGQPIERQIIGGDAFRFISPWVNRQIESHGKWKWQGTQY
jgi:hypothetical protein